MHEILTLSSGPQANYLATHYWNTQLAYQHPSSPVNSSVLFRAGLSSTGAETFLPRALIYDLKPAFGTLARINALDALTSSSAEDSLFHGPAKRIVGDYAEPQPNDYGKALLEGREDVKPRSDTVRFFGDFATGYFHQRSLRGLREPYPTTVSTQASSGQTNGDDTRPQFSSFQHGRELWETMNNETDVMDEHFRSWMEEADAPQGVQMFTSAGDAWGGFAARYLEALRDEYPKLSVWVWGADGRGVRGGSTVQAKARLRERATNSALGLSEFAALGSLYVPLGLPERLPGGVELDRGSLWHVGGLFAAGVDSATLGVRMTGRGGRLPVLGDWEDVLCDGGRRRIAGLKLGMTRRSRTKSGQEDSRTREAQRDLLREDEDPEVAEERLDDGLNTDLSPLEVPNLTRKGRVLGRRNKTFSRIDTFRDDTEEGFTSNKGDERSRWRSGPIIEEYNVQPSFPLLDTFPSIFKSSNDSKSVPIHTSLSASSSIATWVRNVQLSVSAGVGLPGELAGEEREALSNGIAEIAEAYVEGWESGSDSDDE